MKAARLLAITLLLQARGKLTAEGLAHILEVSPRTIYRDIVSLEAARVPVVAESGPEGGYSLPEGYRMDASRFSGEEAASLAIGGAILQGIARGEMAASLQQALAKIEASLPPEYRADVQAGRERFLFDAASWYTAAVAPAEHLSALRSAVLHGRRVRLCYTSRDAAQSEWREVDPLGLVYKAGTWYLVGFCFTRCGIRTFKVGRITGVEAPAPPLPAPPCAHYPGFDLGRYWEESRASLEGHVPYPVRFRADSCAAERLLGRPLAFLRTISLPDEVLEVEIDMESCSWAVGFTLGFGPGLEVLWPPQVREAVAAAALAIATRHR